MLFKRELSNEELRQRYPAVFAEQAHESTSSRYLYVSTDKLISGLTSQGFRIAGAKQQATRDASKKEFTKHVVYLSRENTVTELKRGQEIPLLALTNSHNATSALSIDTAFFRVACSNGLLMPSHSLNSSKVRHNLGMQGQVIEAAYRVLSNFDSQIETINQLKQIEMSKDEKMLLAESAQNLIFEPEIVKVNQEKKHDLRELLLSPRRHDDSKQDLWTVFNVIQENAIKGGRRIYSVNDKGQLGTRTMRKVNSIDRDAKLNQELMSLAQKFAEIKGLAA